MKLTSRLILAIILITTSCLIVFGSYQYNSTQDRLYQSITDRLDADVNFLKASIVQPLFDYNDKGINYCLLAAMTNETILSIIVLGAGVEADQPLYGYYKNTDGEIAQGFVSVTEENMLVRDIELLYAGELIGKVKITASVHAVKKHLQRVVAGEFLRIFILNILLIGFLIVVVRSKVVQPILSLSVVARELAQGDLERKIPKASVKEVAALGKSIDILRKSILSKIETLEEKNTELLRNEKNLSTTLNSIGDAVIATDELGKIVRMNPIAEQLTGWPFTEAKGKKLPDVFVIKNVLSGERCDNPVDIVLQTESRVGLANHAILISKNKTEFHISDSGAPIRNEAGAITGVVLVFRDVSSEYELEEKLRQSQKLESIGTLAGGIAHDFNNILAVIVGQAELIELFDTDIESPVRPRLTEILNASARAKKLINQILAISRHRDILNVPVDLVPMAKEVVNFIRSSAPSTIDIKQNIIDDKAFVLSDPSRMHQLFLNLCTNAIQVMGENIGVLEISLESVHFDKISVQQYTDLTEGSYVMIIISDTGPGITASIQDKIFDPYFTTKNEGEGTGLGLAVVHGIIKSHKGNISVYSEVGQGTTFKVLLPQIHGDIIEIEDNSDKSIEYGSESILLVDDDEQLLQTGSDILEHLAYNVTTHKDSIAALETFALNPSLFDLVITDYTMPRLNGLGLYQELCKIRPDIQVILCSGFGKGLSEEWAKAEGFEAFLNKPFETRSLARTIRSVLDGN